MADNFVAPWGASIGSDEIGCCHYIRTKITFGPEGTFSDVSSETPLPVSIISGGEGGSSGGLTNTELRAVPVPVSGAFYPATQPVSGTVSVSGSVPVTGTFWQATQPVSIASTVNVAGTFWPATQPVSGTVGISGSVAVTGPLTDAQMRASPVPVTGSLSVGGAEVNALFRARACTFRTPGRAGTAGQKIFALHNASGSTRIVHINQLTVDLYQTVVKAITVPPPIIRVHRFTALPTNGTALSKVTKDSSLSANASVTAWGDASADGTGSAQALTVTIPAGNMLTEEFAPRYVTAVGYEMFDRAELLDGRDIVLRAGEGIVVNLDYTAATQNPVTDMWMATCDWYEL
jgi:hypothetical protein